MSPHDLLGRERDLAELEAYLDLPAPDGWAVALVGEPGVGKSALQSVTVESARARGYTVVAARGTPGERHLPFAALHQLIRPALRRAPQLPTRQREALLAAFGLLDDGQPDPFLISLAVLELMSSSATSAPVLWSLDDAHWMDRPTLDVIAFVARRLASEPIRILMSVRAELADEIDSSIRRLPIGPLAEDAAEELLHRAHPALNPLLGETVLRTAEGNPLALLELPIASAPHARGNGVMPPVLPVTKKLEIAFAERARQLPHDSLAVLTVAALDEGANLPELLAAASVLLGTDATVATLQPAMDMGLVALDGWTLTFRHSLVRSAIHQLTGVEDRRAGHAALAAALADQPDRAVWHEAASLMRADEQVAARLEQAADRARRRGAVSTAVAWLELAAQLSPDPAGQASRLLSALEVAFRLGRFALFEQLRQRIDHLALRADDRVRLLWLDGIFNDGRPVPAAVLEDMVRIAAEAAPTDRELAGNVLLGAARRAWWGDPGGGTRQLIVAQTEALGLDPTDPVPLFVFATAVPAERGHFIAEHLQAWDPRGPTPPDVKGMLANAAFCAGDFPLALEFTTDPIELLRSQGQLSLLAQALTLRAWAGVYSGWFDLARASGDEALRLATETTQPVWAGIADIAMAMLGGLRGAPIDQLDMPVAIALVENSGPVPMKSLRAGIQLARGSAELARGEYEAAHATLLKLYDPRESCYHHIQGLFSVNYFAEAAHRSGHLEEARDLLGRLEGEAKGTPAVGVRLPLAYARAVLARDEDAEELFVAALQGHAATSGWHRSRLELAYGSWLRRQRRVAEAREPLRAARQTFDALGVTSWASQADRELRATGEGGWQPTGSSWDRLSPQETQIAELAAQGLSNRDIGQQLYLSHRTVGSHLYRIFPKLGITSRAQLGRALRPEATRDASPTT